MMPSPFDPFVKQTPICVMARLTLERLFLPQRLDQLFRAVAQEQYQKNLLFSQLFEIMMAVVLRIDASVHAAYRKRQPVIPVSDQAVYDKLQHLELGVSAALVADSAAQVAPVIKALGARLPAWLPGFRVRVLDGNLLSKTQKRVRELRRTWAAGLPGRVLAVYEPESDLVTRVFLNPDGHDSERTLFDEVLKTVEARDVWIADRNFCTLKFLFRTEAAGARFVVRQHGTLVGTPAGDRRFRGRTATGMVFEQKWEWEWEGKKRRFRRITLVLDVPTRDGDTDIHLLTNLRKAEAGAGRVADLYRRRWTIEGRFYELSQTLNGEPNTLGYPKAALFAFCLALMASNAAALLRAALRAAHGAEAVDTMSGHYMAEEMRETHRGMMVALPPEMWHPFRELTVDQWAVLLKELAGRVRPAAYRKSTRGPKKPPPDKGTYHNGGHVATQRLIEQRNGGR